MVAENVDKTQKEISYIHFLLVDNEILILSKETFPDFQTPYLTPPLSYEFLYDNNIVTEVKFSNGKTYRIKNPKAEDLYEYPTDLTDL